MADTLPKILLAILGAVTILILLIWLYSSSGPLEVTYEDNFLKIQNVGDSPVEIKGVSVNDRADCAILNVAPQGNILKVGDSLVLMTLCDAVRTTITSTDGSSTHHFNR
jgi:hypothetical protein